jgi:tRNA threonylcarbamoyladenosine biosynthesis protein TsaB
LKILGIETSSHLFSLCVNEDDKMLCEIRKNRVMDESRDAHFFVEAERIIEHYGIKNIEAIAVDTGPGMFTSLRVGLSLAKGLALSHSIPIVGVNALDVIGIPISLTPISVLAVINAYHGEIYAALYEQGKRMTDYLLTTPGEVKKMIKGQTLIIGSGIDVFQKSQTDNSNLYFLRGNFLFPTASKVILLGLHRIQKGDFDNPEGLEPYYIKKTDAERHYDKTNAL